MSDIGISKVRRLDGALLLVFRELLRRKRASDAATALGLSQSAVSHALARLRDLFGDPLFVRRPHGLEPTRRALALGPQIEALLELTNATLKGEGGFDPARSERRFMVAAPDFVIALVGATLVEQMREEAPGVSFHMQNLSHAASVDALRRGEIDLAIGRFGSSAPGFDVEALHEDTYCVVARRGHPRFKRRIDLRAYMDAGHVFSLAPGEGGEGEDVASASRLRVAAVVPRWLTVLAMVSACDAIGTVPRALAERHAATFGLVILDAPFVNGTVAISLMRRAGVQDEGVDWFCDQLRAAIG